MRVPCVCITCMCGSWNEPTWVCCESSLLILARRKFVRSAKTRGVVQNGRSIFPSAQGLGAKLSDWHNPPFSRWVRGLTPLSLCEDRKLPSHRELFLASRQPGLERSASGSGPNSARSGDYISTDDTARTLAKFQGRRPQNPELH